MCTQPSDALQLRWGGGATDLVATDSVRATLNFDASDLVGGLPAEWRLVFVADSAALRFVAPDSLGACASSVGLAQAIAPPATPFDSTANQFTAQFCSSPVSWSATAQYVIDVAGGTHARLKAVAIMPGTASTVIESNEVTVNGGLTAPFAPTILAATSEHQSLTYSLSVVGTDLESASSIAVAAPDGDWTVPLRAVNRTPNRIVAEGLLAAPVPEGVASVGSKFGTVSGVGLAAESEPSLDLLAPTGGVCSAQFFEEYFVPGPGTYGYAIQPKDFAVVPGFVDPANGRYGLHIFYIRHNYNLHPPARPIDSPNLDEKNLGHAWTSDFTSWHGPAPGDKPDTMAVKVRVGKIDNLHVWAPSIVRSGPIYHMFYTAVEEVGSGSTRRENQRIGVATSTDLNTWTQEDAAVLTVADVPWSMRNPPPSDQSGQQLRDPYVMEDPTQPGQWLMFFVSVDSVNSPSFTRMAVGVAKSTDLRHWTATSRPFVATERPTALTDARTIESPHVIRRNGKWWMMYTVDKDQVFFETYGSGTPADTTGGVASSGPASWIGPVRLKNVTEGQPAQLQYWHATEHLGSGANEYLAAWNDNAVSIEVTGMAAASNAAVDSLKLGCPSPSPVADVGDDAAGGRSLRLVLPAVILSARGADIEFWLPEAGPVRLRVYDALGRQRAELIKRDCPKGRTVIPWSPADSPGAQIASGLYFLRLETGNGSQTRRVVLLH